MQQAMVETQTPTTGTVPPLRQNNQPDAQDSQRVAWAWHHWRSQDQVLFERDRQIEENVRMLVGQQWTYWSERQGRYINVEQWLNEDERRWRQRPVMNRILMWFLLSHARLTENVPIIGFLPGPDRIDAELAEMMDILCKTVWREANMADVLDRMATWLLPGGEVATMCRIDWNRGPWRDWVGQGTLPLIGPDGQPVLGPDGQPFTQQFPEVGYSEQGQPVVQFTEQGLTPIVGPDGKPLKPHAEREGQIIVDVLSPMEVRGEWGPTPWHEKKWHARVSFLTTEEIEETFGVADVKPDSGAGQDQNAGLLDRMLFGGGLFGAAERRTGAENNGGHQWPDRAKLNRVLELWEKPNARTAGMKEAKDQPGGRYMACTSTKLLRDGTRPAAFPYTSPIQVLEFIRLPGRNRGSSLQESLNSPQRAMNRLAGHQFEHVALQAHPIGLIQRGSGLEKVRVTNKPGQFYTVNATPGEPLKFVAAPQLSSDLYRAHQGLMEFLTTVGNIQNSPGEAPTRDASGELVKELRWDRDRWLGPMTRRFVEFLARMHETWVTLLPFIFSTERILSYTGDDNVARTLTVLPHLFQEGKANVVGDPESMFPEGRGERQSRIHRLWTEGAFGDSRSPQAIAKMFELSRFPHLSRAAKPGGIDRTTAEQNLGALLQGAMAQEIPLYPWYDLPTHLEVYRNYMASPDFKKIDPAIQGQLALLWQTAQQALFDLMPPEPALEEGPPARPGRGGRGPTRGGQREEAERAERSSAHPPRGPVRAANRPPILPERIL